MKTNPTTYTAYNIRQQPWKPEDFNSNSYVFGPKIDVIIHLCIGLLSCHAFPHASVKHLVRNALLSRILCCAAGTGLSYLFFKCFAKPHPPKNSYHTCCQHQQETTTLDQDAFTSCSINTPYTYHTKNCPQDHISHRPFSDYRAIDDSYPKPPRRSFDPINTQTTYTKSSGSPSSVKYSKPPRCSFDPINTQTTYTKSSGSSSSVKYSKPPRCSFDPINTQTTYTKSSGSSSLTPYPRARPDYGNSKDGPIRK